MKATNFTLNHAILRQRINAYILFISLYYDQKTAWFKSKKYCWYYILIAKSYVLLLFITNFTNS